MRILSNVLEYVLVGVPLEAPPLREGVVHHGPEEGLGVRLADDARLAVRAAAAVRKRKLKMATAIGTGMALVSWKELRMSYIHHSSPN